MTNFTLYFVALISILLGSLAQYFLKIGMISIDLKTNLTKITKDIITSLPLISGIFCYALSLIFWLIVLSKMELSKAYPMVSLGYVFTLLLGYFLLGENINLLKILGIFFIMVGVYTITRS